MVEIALGKIPAKICRRVLGHSQEKFEHHISRRNSEQILKWRENFSRTCASILECVFCYSISPVQRFRKFYENLRQNPDLLNMAPRIRPLSCVCRDLANELEGGGGRTFRLKFGCAIVEVCGTPLPSFHRAVNSRLSPTPPAVLESPRQVSPRLVTPTFTPNTGVRPSFAIGRI